VIIRDCGRDMKSQSPNPKTQIPITMVAVLVVVMSGVGRTFVAQAQEGHPLVGTWHGTWGPNATDRRDVTLVLEFDGKAITGIMNPGLDSVRFDRITLEPSTWSVHFEATPKQAAGRAAAIVIDARIEDVTSRRRSLSGTWTQGATKGDFKASRDD
jgi:hypothetical protein